MSREFDIAVVGGGAAGVAAAMEARRLGARAVLIERERLLGGASWHRGRLPARLLQAAVEDRKGRPAPGSDGAQVELARLLPNLDAIRESRSAELAQQLQAAGVVWKHARARLTGPQELELITVEGARETLRARWILLATGDRPGSLRGARIDHEAVLDLGSLLSAVFLPRSVVVAGATATACEMAGLLAHLGSEVTLAVPGDRVLPEHEAFLGAAFTEAFVAAGGRLLWNHRVTHAQKDGTGGARCHLSSTLKHSGEDLHPDRVVLATHRKATLRGLGLDTLGIQRSATGYLTVDPHFRTERKSVLAVGAVIGSGSSPRRAMHQARSAVQLALGASSGAPLSLPHFVETVRTVPELASIGTNSGDHTIALGTPQGDGGFKVVASPDQRVIGLHCWGTGAEATLQPLLPVVREGWSLQRLASSPLSVHRVAAQVARTLQEGSHAMGPAELDPDDLLAGKVTASAPA